MNSFPSELLIRVFVLLDPTALSKAQLVCKRWHTVIADERSWRDALLIGLGRLPFLRLQPQSWRREYIDRLNRIRQWKFDRIHSVTFDARIGDLTHTFVEFLDSSMLVGNLTRGLAVPCHITTGKVDNRSAYTSPEMASLITSMNVERNRILWGYENGVVFLQRVSRQQRQRRQILFEHRHVGAVQCIASVKGASTRLATGGNDGLVHLWEASTGKWIASLNGGQPIIAVQLDRNAHVVAVTSRSLLIWTMDTHEDMNGQTAKAPHYQLALFNEEGPTHLCLLSSSIAIATSSDTTFVVDITNGQLIRQQSLHYQDGVITSLATLDKTLVFVCGYRSGAIALWSAEHASCLWRVDAHVGAITALAIDDDKVVSAGIDGRVIVWELLSGAFRCTFKLVDRSSNTIESPMPVSAIYLGMNELVVAFGDRVKSWTIGYRGHALDKQKSGRSSRRGHYASMRDAVIERQHLKQEIEEEIEHTTQYLKNRRQEAEYQQTLLKTYNNLEGLSDEELLHYTMMLSMEESPSMHSQASSDGNTNTESDEERLLAEREAKDLEDAIRLSMQLK